MTQRHLGPVRRWLSDLLDERSGLDVSDGELLERFVAVRDEAAFALLVQRHGPLVFGTCRRLLRDVHLAEDAFQATFLVLLRRAGSLERRPLGGWLHGVATRIALRARARDQRRRTREPAVDGVADLPEPAGATAPSGGGWRELRTVLDEEMQHLPDRYRQPLVLCYLQGKTHEQAAQELGWPSGSMSRHLARGRWLLQQRLARRGVTGSAALLGVALSDAAAATLPPRLSRQLVQIGLAVAAGRALHEVVSAEATALVEGAVQAMHMNKLHVGAALGLLIGLTTTAGAMFCVPPAAVTPPTALLAAVRGDDTPPPPARPAKVTLAHDTAVQLAVLSPDGALVATFAGTTIRLWDAVRGTEIRRRELEAPGQVGRLVFAPDSKSLAWTQTGPLGGPNPDRICTWDVAADKMVRTFETGPPSLFMLNALTFAPDGKLLACGVGDAGVQLWDVALEKVREQLPWRGVCGLAFSPDGQTLATARAAFMEKRNGVFLPTADKDFLALWTVESGPQLRVLTGPPAPRRGYLSVAFSPDGQLLAAQEESSRTLRLWETATGKVIRSVPGGLPDRDDGRRHPQLAFAPDDSVLSTGNGGQWLRLGALFQGAASVHAHGPGVGQFVRLAKGRALAIRHAGNDAIVEDVSDLLRAARAPRVDLTAQELATLWDDLAGEPERAYAALARLSVAPDQAVPFLHGKLRDLPPLPDAARLAQLVADLGSNQFATREQAHQELARLGELARGALEQARARRPALDVTRRIDQLLAFLTDVAPDQLRLMRTIAVLEQTHSATARPSLTILADGAAGARLAALARRALERMEVQ